MAPGPCGNCDVCTRKKQETRDFSAQVRLLLTAVRQTGEKYGLAIPILVRSN